MDFQAPGCGADSARYSVLSNAAKEFRGYKAVRLASQPYHNNDRRFTEAPLQHVMIMLSVFGCLAPIEKPLRWQG